MQLIASGKWLKVEKRWKMVIAMRRPALAAAPQARKAPKRAEVVSIGSLRPRQSAE